MDLQASLTPQEVSELLKITKNTVYELIKRGELPSYKIGKKIRIDMHDVEAYINNQKNSLKITDSKNISSTSRRNAQITNNQNFILILMFYVLIKVAIMDYMIYIIIKFQ